MSAATLEDTQPAPDDQLAEDSERIDTTPTTRPQWAKALGAVEDGLTGGSPEDQKEAGRAIVRFAVGKGEKLRGPNRLTGHTMAKHFAWSSRWWRDRLREVRESVSPTKLTVVTNAPATAPNHATADAAEVPRAGDTAADANRATQVSDSPATDGNGTNGEAVARVASIQPDRVASLASADAPPVPTAAPEDLVGTGGRADLAAAQHTARSPRAMNLAAASQSGQPEPAGSHGVTGTTGTATTKPGDQPAEMTAASTHRGAHATLAGRSSGTGWPEPRVTTESGLQRHNPQSAAAEGLPEPPAASSEASTHHLDQDDPEPPPMISVEPPQYAFELAAAWGAGELQTQRPARGSQPTTGPAEPGVDDTAVASPLPAATSDQTAPLPPTAQSLIAPLPPEAPHATAGTEQTQAHSLAGPALATPTAQAQAATADPATADQAANVASAAQPRGTAEQPPPAVASSAADAPAAGKGAWLQYAFYGTASLFALLGQVWAAVDHITIGVGWPTWAQAIAMAPALAVIELAGVATSHQADLRRRLGEQAYGYRALSLMAAMVAAGVNLAGHWGEWFPAVGFTGLSVFAYCSWLMQSAARRRDALRAAGQMANTAPVFGPIQWIRQPSLTWRARLIAISEGHGRSESLLLAAQRIHRERRDKAIAKAVRKVIKAQKKDANGAKIAVATIDPDKLAAALKARTDYDAWTDHLGADLAPPALDAG